jgi:hypothetical protein
MPLRHHAELRDSNEPEIVTALEAVGASVTRLGSKGVPDLLVGYRGETFLLEVKHVDAKGKTVRRWSGGKKPDERGLTEQQQTWWATWTGKPPVIVRTPEEALRAIGALNT